MLFCFLSPSKTDKVLKDTAERLLAKNLTLRVIITQACQIMKDRKMLIIVSVSCAPTVCGAGCQFLLVILQNLHSPPLSLPLNREQGKSLEVFINLSPSPNQESSKKIKAIIQTLSTSKEQGFFLLQKGLQKSFECIMCMFPKTKHWIAMNFRTICKDSQNKDLCPIKSSQKTQVDLKSSKFIILCDPWSDFSVASTLVL